MTQQQSVGVYIGRFDPVHLGHERVIQAMVDKHGSDSLLLLGSCSKTPVTLANPFTYSERADFIGALFPELQIAPLPDYYGNDGEWLVFVHDLICLRTGWDSLPDSRSWTDYPATQEVTFYGGCQEDVAALKPLRCKGSIVDRFEDKGYRISSQEVRTALSRSMSLEGLVNPKIALEVQGLFASKWSQLVKQ